MFSTLPKTEFLILATLNLSSANALNLDQFTILLSANASNLDQSKILLFGKKLSCHLQILTIWKAQIWDMCNLYCNSLDIPYLVLVIKEKYRKESKVVALPFWDVGWLKGIITWGHEFIIQRTEEIVWKADQWVTLFLVSIQCIGT